MADKVLLRKAQIIERCLARILEVYDGDRRNLREDFTKQDSILLNLERACQAAIDAGNRMIRLHRLGLPSDTKGVFVSLKEGGALEESLAESLGNMVGFRNVAVHDYQELKLEIVQSIIEVKLDDLRRFAQLAIRFE